MEISLWFGNKKIKITVVGWLYVTGDGVTDMSERR